MDQKKILITGASSALTHDLVPILKKDGYQLRLTDLGNTAKTIPEIEILTGDIQDLSFITQATKNIDIIIHLAGLTHTNQQNKYYQINTRGTENIVKAAEGNAVEKFIYVSTRAIGDKKTAGVYGHSKLLAENAVKNSGLNWTILRPAEIYGSGLKKSMVNSLIEKIQKTKNIPIVGDGQYMLSPVHINDVVRAIANCVNNNQTINKTYTLAGSKSYKYTEFIDLIAKKLNKKINKLYLHIPLVKIIFWLFSFLKNPPFVKDQIPRLLCTKQADIHPARRDLNFDPVEFNLTERLFKNKK